MKYLCSDRIRRVKCDEGRPACRCCLSTGRVCEGYGIWGGGGNRYDQRSTSSATVRTSKTPPSNASPVPKLQIEKAPAPSPLGGASVEEQGYFEFFSHCTAAKLPGVFGITFWNSIVFQACANEPAVLHAVLALSASHKRKEADSLNRDRSSMPMDRQEEFLLRHYSKAIGYLQPKYLRNGKNATRTALIACLIFIYTDFLRGNYKSGCKHLESGLKLVKEISPANKTGDVTLTSPGTSLASKLETLDGCLFDAFARLQVQVALTGRKSQPHDWRAETIYNKLPTLKFGSPNEARYHLDRIFDGVNHAIEEYYKFPDIDSFSDTHRRILSTDQKFTQAALDCWQMTYDATAREDTFEEDSYTDFAYRLLRLYHTMASIMVATCLSLDYQTTYDAHINNFLSIIVQSIQIATKANQPEIHKKLGQENKWFHRKCEHTISDIGWVSPLYYTALKCRNHRLRVQATKLLGSRAHNDGIWDSKLAGTITTEIIRIEEQGLFEDRKDDFGKDNVPSEEDLQEAEILPEERRMQKVECCFPADGTERIVVKCQRRVNGKWHAVRRVYNDTKHTWRCP